MGAFAPHAQAGIIPPDYTEARSVSEPTITSLIVDKFFYFCIVQLCRLTFFSLECFRRSLTRRKEIMMMNLKKELQAVKKEMQAVSKKMEKIIAATGQLEKSKTAKAKPAKKRVVKKPVSKKPAAASAIDSVFAIIKRSKKGVDTATLMEKTGFNEKKIFNNVYKLKKRGMIKSKQKGLYISV